MNGRVRAGVVPMAMVGLFVGLQCASGCGMPDWGSFASGEDSGVGPGNGGDDSGPASGSSGGGSSGGSSSGSAAGSSSGSGGGSSSGSSSGSGSGGSSGAGDDGGGDSGPPSCAYTNDAQFCACLGNYNCGGITIADSSGTNRTVFCGGCAAGTWCQPGPLGVGIGTCGGTDPIQYDWQRQKINMLVSMGENDNTTLNYGACGNINDGRGYTIGQVGFCSGTGDFILVAACYNDRSPGNVLAKYWNALVAINNAYISTMMNQGAVTTLTAIGNFCGDVATAAANKDGIFVGCQNDMGDALYMAQALQHAQDRGLSGLLTLGFLYDTELNFGEQDDPGGLGGTATVIARADKDYGAGLPTNFSGLTWEESRWLGFLIQERAVEMTGNSTWKGDTDQDATWEGARRLHTAKTNSPESGTDLSMSYDIVSAYKTGSTSAGGACWKAPPLLSTNDSQSTVYTVSLNKSASATDQSLWVATGTKKGSYAACPADPTP
jgi:hypothetical protein